MLTQKEIYIIEAIISNELCGNNNYLPPQDTPYDEANSGECWADTLELSGAQHGERVTGKSISGVVSSLIKKGFVRSNYAIYCEDATLEVTAAGWTAYRQAELIKF